MTLLDSFIAPQVYARESTPAAQQRTDNGRQIVQMLFGEPQKQFTKDGVEVEVWMTNGAAEYERRAYADGRIVDVSFRPDGSVDIEATTYPDGTVVRTGYRSTGTKSYTSVANTDRSGHFFRYRVDGTVMLESICNADGTVIDKTFE